MEANAATETNSPVPTDTPLDHLARLAGADPDALLAIFCTLDREKRVFAHEVSGRAAFDYDSAALLLLLGLLDVKSNVVAWADLLGQCGLRRYADLALPLWPVAGEDTDGFSIVEILATVMRGDLLGAHSLSVGIEGEELRCVLRLDTPNEAPKLAIFGAAPLPPDAIPEGSAIVSRARVVSLAGIDALAQRIGCIEIRTPSHTTN